MVLLIATKAQLGDCLPVLDKEAGEPVRACTDLKQGLKLLAENDISAVVVDQHALDSDPRSAAKLWAQLRAAVPVVFKPGVTSGRRLAQELRAALTRLRQE